MSNQLNNVGILRKFLMAVSIGMISLTISPAYSACDEITVNCKNQQIEVLKKQIADLEIINAELQYDVDDLKSKFKSSSKSLKLCEINLKNVKVEIESCGKR
ncbi:hypothetical protein OAY00_04515 [Burkholderiales bacterium]|nr:hypothetical protein [Burkholderiales bacterium]